MDYLCPNMTNFDAMDFSERRSEEVISFFWRSMYILNQKSKFPCDTFWYNLRNV